jgi:hypothetical protein
MMAVMLWAINNFELFYESGENEDYIMLLALKMILLS